MVAENNENGRPAPSGSGSGSAPATQTRPDSDAAPKSGGFHKGRFDHRNPSHGRGRGGRGGRGRGDWGGSRGNRGGRGGGKRKDFDREDSDRRRIDKPRNREWTDRKRRKVDEDGDDIPDGEAAPASYMNIPFSEQEIAAEDRRPKRKVAVMIGYAGTGYHGMQINHREKTIEGDIFGALVTAGAIAKANADDPRKSNLVRCARTDKGVHAAGNVISLKLIIEDLDLVKKINDALPPQIRVWGIQRTNNSFSCYQTCDSRYYEYLMPSYCLLPPHHESYLGKKVLDAIKEHGVEEEYGQRLSEVKEFWQDVEKNQIQPILDSLDAAVREEVLRKLHLSDSDPDAKSSEPTMQNEEDSEDKPGQDTTTEPAEKDIPGEIAVSASPKVEVGNTVSEAIAPQTETQPETVAPAPGTAETDAADNPAATSEAPAKPPKALSPVDIALKRIKAAYVSAKRSYRVTPDRLSQLQTALDQYEGTRNFHNYTIQKSYNDPSAKRLIKSFIVNPTPVQINDTQWLSLKVHGQSFMMHQIRKMVGMALLVVRCGTPLARFEESYTATRISIPKAPGLGLLLERPVFGNYNNRARENYDKPQIDFANYEKEIQEFKDTQIYRRIFELEEKENSFHTFFHQIDNFKSDYFLWVTAGGMAAARKRIGQTEDVPDAMKEELGDEGEDVEGGEG